MFSDPVNHPLWSYETGPVLLVLPDTSDQSGSSSVSCDAWFLWKPEAINVSAFTLTESITTNEGLCISFRCKKREGAT